VEAAEMAWTQADLDTLDAAIASGVRRVRYSDGSEVEYRSLAEMKGAQDLIAASLDEQAGRRRVRSFRASFRSGY